MAVKSFVRRQRAIAAFFATLAWLAGSTNARADDIIAVQNPEDIVAVPDSHFAIVSSMPGNEDTAGSIIAVDSRTYKKTRLFPNEVQVESVPEGSACSSPPVSSAFAPHGIALTGRGTDMRLYVINHDARNSIDIFDVASEKGSISLAWRDCIPVVKGAMVNSVTVVGDTVFSTNNGKPLDSDSADSDGTDILAWSAESGWSQAIPGHFGTPNGILADPAGTHLYVALWNDSEVVKIKPGPEGTIHQRISLDFKPDNLRWDIDGMILATGQVSDLDTIMGCANNRFGAGRPCPIDSGFVRIDPSTMQVICKREVPSSEFLGAATVAAPVDESLWLGQFHGSAVLVTSRLSPPSSVGGC